MQLFLEEHRMKLEEHVMQWKAEVSDWKADAVSLLHKEAFLEQSFPCSWAVKQYICPREVTACQHKFKTSSN